MTDHPLYEDAEPGLPFGSYETDYCEDCGIRLDRHGEECGFERGDTNAPEYGRPAGWLNPGTGEFTPIEGGDGS